jgi:NAD(P)-dependent dehydrogenase (short-subunit alcohol dehydrogenase family)
MARAAVTDRSSGEARFAGRTAVVTGGAGEIGRAVARRLAAEGARTLIVDIEPDGVAAAVHEVVESGGQARGCIADVTDAVDVAAYARAADEFGGGRIDLFVNNAGIVGPVADIPAFPDEDFDRVMAVNVRGVFLGLKHVLPHVPYGGAVVNTASTAGIIGSPGLVAYIASKHAVVGMTKVAALEQARRGVRVNALCPGPVEGRMMSDIERGKGLAHEETAARIVPMGRYATVEEVASLACVLLSPELGFTTGGVFTADGGQTAA